MMKKHKKRSQQNSNPNINPHQERSPPQGHANGDQVVFENGVSEGEGDQGLEAVIDGGEVDGEKGNEINTQRQEADRAGQRKIS